MSIQDTPAAEAYAFSRRNSLRGATDHLHRDLDRLLAGFKLGEPTHYRRFLQASAATLIAIEQLVESAGVAQLLPDWAERTRREPILHDLHSLQSHVQPLALRRTAPTPAEVFGILYVVEGLRVDARGLLDQVLASGDENVRSACAYLGHGLAEANLWGSFLEQLETHEAADDQTQTVSGAVYAFTMFIRAFSQAAAELRARTAPAAPAI